MHNYMYNSDKIIHKSHFEDFFSFLNDNNTVAIVFASMLAERVGELSKSIVHDIILPIINRDANKDGIKDIKKIEDFYINIKGCKFAIGNLIVVLIKFFLITWVLFVVSKFIKAK